MKKENKIYSFDRGTFNKFLSRKKNQSKEEQNLEAGFLISEINTIDIDKAFSILESKINRQNRIKVLYYQFRKFAAILIIPLFIFTLWSLTRERHIFEDSQLSFQEIENPMGIRSKIILPDGSKVWLNAGSKIKYSIPFVRETRELELIGEAFFDIAKNPESPLDVKFDNFNVRVLGTKFNVKNFQEDQRIGVVLKEGRIQLGQNEMNSKYENVVLKPDQQWIYDKGKKAASVRNVDADKLTMWHQNILLFNDTPMGEVALQIERWYGVDVEIKDEELYQYKFTTVFDNEPLSVVLELLEMSSPIKIKYIPEKINKSSGFSENAKIQISAIRKN
ncbi:FecR family protein [Sunxiuqinia sp. A32]|uniref:FecR family protein n=1 Tax=Sunxiuqinia sp. A32 TaxID=3461496 RepID=UPI00404639E6